MKSSDPTNTFTLKAGEKKTIRLLPPKEDPMGVLRSHSMRLGVPILVSSQGTSSDTLDIELLNEALKDCGPETAEHILQIYSRKFPGIKGLIEQLRKDNEPLDADEVLNEIL